MKDDKCGYFDVLNVDEDKVTNTGLAGNCVINYKVETYKYDSNNSSLSASLCVLF